MGLSLLVFPWSPRPRVRGFHPGPAAGLPNDRVPQATRALGPDLRGDGPSVPGAPLEPPALPLSSFGEVTPRALRPRPQPRARSAGGGEWATRVLCAVGKPAWAPCPCWGLSSQSSGPSCGRPQALGGSWVVVREGTLPAGGKSQAGRAPGAPASPCFPSSGLISAPGFQQGHLGVGNRAELGEQLPDAQV